jgi:DedD protein
MAQLRNRNVIGGIVLIALLIIFLPLFFKRLQSSLRPLAIPSMPAPPNVIQLGSELNLLESAFKTHLSAAKAWVLQVGEFHASADANLLVATLRSKGFKAYIQESNGTSGLIFRVFVGPEINFEQINHLSSQLQEEMHLNTTIKNFDPLFLYDANA